MLLLAIFSPAQRSQPASSSELSAVPAADPGPSPLDLGFSDLYDLDFASAQREFTAWEKAHPDDPSGPVSEAAGYLFSEFNRLGVLESQFFADDKFLAGRTHLTPDAATRDHFENALARAEALAQTRRAKDSRDSDALFSLTLASGLRADYAALIEKRNFASLHYTRQAADWAQQLLAADPKRYDALLATGFTKYVIGSMSAPVRWLLRMGGLPGDKQSGISDLKIVATQGHYLAPFARILLSIAYVREADKPHAIELLTGLRQQFPANPLFDREIQRLQSTR